MKKLNTVYVMFMKKIMVALFALVIAAPASLVGQQHVTGSGTSADPYLIKDSVGFMDFHSCMVPGSQFYYDGNTFVQTTTSHVIPAGAQGIYFKLDCDLIFNRGDVAGCEGVKADGWTDWVPMDVFTGHFDGNYHTISGLYTNTPEQQQVALFRQLSDGGEIKNIGVTNSYFKGGGYVAGIVGIVLHSSSVTECFFEGSLEAVGHYCGGIVGNMSDNSTVSDCYATGSLRAVSSAYYIGGIVGYNPAGCHTTNCYSSMCVESTTGTSGGIYGYNEGYIENCYFDKQMTDKLPGESVALLTTEMCLPTWTALGSKFVCNAGHYPILKGFSDAGSIAAQLSTLTVFFNTLSTSQYETIFNLHTDCSVTNSDGVTWSVTSWNDAISVSGTLITLNCHGAANLIASKGDYTRTIMLYSYYGDQAGSATNPLTIDSKTDLENFRNGINSGADFTYKRMLVHYADLPNTYWRQTTDIDLGSISNWVAIGIKAVPFSGHYTGDRHTISNLKITDGAACALFGYVENAVIERIGFIDASVKGKNAAVCCSRASASVLDSIWTSGGTVTSTENHAGGICSYAGNGTLINRCTNATDLVKNSASSATTDGTSRTSTGGIVGYNTSSTTVKYCINHSEVTSGSEIGGIVGQGGTIQFCWNTGYVHDPGDEMGGISSMGSTIQYCINTGKLKGRLVGGIQSWSSGSIFGCINAGDVYISGTSTSAGGGGLSRHLPVNHSCNFGMVKDEINSSSLQYGVTGLAATSDVKTSYNAGRMEAALVGKTCYASGSNVDFYDKQFIGNEYATSNGTACTQSQMIGKNPTIKSTLRTDNWIYEDNMYPRPRWTDTVDWARDVAIAICSPVVLATTEEDFQHVKPGVKIPCRSSRVTWEVDGCLFSALGSCTDSVLTPTINPDCGTVTTVKAIVDGRVVKTVKLYRNTPAVSDTLLICSKEDLKTLRDGINSGAAFTYKGHEVPRFADSCYFKIADTVSEIVLDEANWTPIGLAPNAFGGILLGNHKTIRNVTSNVAQNSGLFDKVTGTIQDLNVEDVNIQGAADKFAGAICAQLWGGTLRNCTARGTITTTGLYAGGLVGKSNTAQDTIIGCTNYVNITNAPTSVSTISYFVGGVIGRGNTAYIRNCINAGSVTGRAGCTYTGGICGSGSPSFCFNTGWVSATQGDGTANHYVGGIAGVGNSSIVITYCYNAGFVNGGNRKYVGGLIGSGKVQYGYNSNTVKSTGTYAGSICGNVQGTYVSVKDCYYDRRLSPMGGVNNADNTDDKALGKRYSEMKGENLKDLLGTNDNWNFTDGNGYLYPQLAVFATSDISRSSVMATDIDTTYDKIDEAFFTYGCNTTEGRTWQVVSGNSINVAASDCKATVPGQGITVLGAAVHDSVYRKVRLITRISATNPLFIKDSAELVHFRDVINSELGYYNPTSMIYKTELSTEDNPNDYIEISDGGRDIYFKLLSNINAPSTTWTPIGDNSQGYSFRGILLGDNFTISGLRLGAGNHQGLFGRVEGGEVRDLTVKGAVSTGTGTYKGMLCGANVGGKLYNCTVTDSRTNNEAAERFGMICGHNSYGTITKCYGVRDTILCKGSYVGGICGLNYVGVVDSCSSDRLYMKIPATSPAKYYTGGVVGFNDGATIDHSSITNSYINSERSYTGGICGYNSGTTSSSYIKNCLNVNTVMVTSYAYIGGIVGYNSTSTAGNYCSVNNCHVRGGSITSTGSYVGGICGYQYYTSSSYNLMKYCSNENSIKGNQYVGGICGCLATARIDYCHNYGNVQGTSTCVGGICGYLAGAGYVYYCGNSGNVTGESNDVGGVVGYSYSTSSTPYLRRSFNTGMVTGANCVGGVVGCANYYNSTQYCYNAGIVKGVSQVGGVLGAMLEPHTSAVTVSDCYNTGWVEGTSMMGAICGHTPEIDRIGNCYYDVQMSHYAGISNEDVEGKSIPKKTTEMLGEGIITALGGNTVWTSGTGMYPRLVAADTTRAAIGSVMPVILIKEGTTDTVMAWDVPVGIYSLSGCDSISWVRYSGYGIYPDAPTCKLSVDGRNIVRIANLFRGDTIKVVHLVLGISEENPLEIKNLEQFKNFRDLIDSGRVFYYDVPNQAFLASPTTNSVEIQPYGEGMYFKLITDIDLTAESRNWTPIGDYSNGEARFKGNFNGDNHTVTGMTITGNKDYQGLFGYLQGTVKNVRMIGTELTASGNYHGAIAGYNAGTILHCGSVQGEIAGTNYVGGIAGSNVYDQVSNSYNGCEIHGADYVGGIAGNSWTAGMITRCFNSGMISGTNYVGGISGATNVENTYCYNTGAVNGTSHVAGITGWSVSRYVHHCYNAGYVSGDSYVGAIATAGDFMYYPNNCYYDQQLCPLAGGIGTETSAGDYNRTSPYYTEEMVGEGLRSVLDTVYWSYHANEYPRLKSLDTLDASVVSVQPVYLPENMLIDQIALAFTAPVTDVTWSRSGTGRAVDVTGASTGLFELLTCGNDTLKVTRNNEYRLIPLNVYQLSGAVVVDTVCNGFFRWEANGRIYTESVDVTIALTASEGCDSVMSLKLTIPPAINISMDVRNRDCYNDGIDYAEATVTGGFESGYYYYWTKEGEPDTISRTNRIENVGPGNYRLSVRDRIYPDCEKTADVTITEPTELVSHITGHDSCCYNQNDGYIAFDVEGGTIPYTVSWLRGSATDTLPPISSTTLVNDTLTDLADGNYTVTIADANGCYHTYTGITIADNATEYSLTAVGVNKKYDGVSVDLGRYVLQVGSAIDTIVSGGFKVLSTGDTLRATVSNTTTVLDVTSQESNNIVDYTITRNGEDKLCRYNVTTHSSPVQISKRNVTLTSGTASKLYDGTPLVKHHVTVSGDGFIGVEDTASITYTGEQTAKGSSDNTFEYTLNSSTNPDNYNITKSYGTLSVNGANELMIVAASATKMYDNTDLTAPTFSYVGLAATDTIIGVTVTGVQHNAGTSYNVLDTLSYRIEDKTSHISTKGSYDTITLVKGTLEVTKRHVNLSTVNASKEYDGTPLSAPAVTISGDGFVETGVSVTADVSITTPDTVDNAITITGLADPTLNYIITKNEGTLAISKRALTITGASRSLAYNGTEQEITGFSAPSLLPDHAFASSFTYSAKGTKKGEYAGSFSSFPVIKAGEEDVTSCYAIDTVPGTLTITASESQFSITSNSQEFEYDGQVHTYYSYTVKYNNTSITDVVNDTVYTLPTGDQLTIHPAGAGRGIKNVAQSGANAFTYDLENATNYGTPDITTGNIRITRRELELRSPNMRGDYTGNPFPRTIGADNIERAGRGVVIGENVVITRLTQETNVGTYVNDFTYAPDAVIDTANYHITLVKGNVVIDPVMLTVTPIDTARIYGEADPEFHYTVTGFVHDEDTVSAPFIGTARPVLTPTSTAASPAGRYTITVDLTGVTFQNYTVRAEEGVFRIRQRSITVKANSKEDIVYDGERHTYEETPGTHYTVVGSGLMVGDTVTSVLILGERTVSGTTIINLSGVEVKHKVDPADASTWTDVTGSYNIQTESGRLTILPRELTIRPKPYTAEFTGQTYSSASTASPHYDFVAGTTLATNDTIVTITINGSRSSAGKTPFVIDSASIIIVDKTECIGCDLNDPQYNMTSGYHITLLTDTLTVNHRTSQYAIDMQGKDTILVYNGTNQYRALSGFVRDTFSFDGFRYKVEDLVSKFPDGTNVTDTGTYNTTISGTARVIQESNGEDVTAEFAITSTPGKLRITPKNMTITAKGVEHEYDGLPHGYQDNATPYEKDGLIGSDNIVRYKMTGERTIVGRETIHVIADSVVIENSSHTNVTSNYHITVVDSAVRITPRTTLYTIELVSKGNEITYDSEDHLLTGFVDTVFTKIVGSMSTPVQYHVEGMSATTGTQNSVGKYANVISGTPVVKDAENNIVTDQFEVTQTVDTLVINKLAITITADDSVKLYDGTALTDQGYRDNPPVLAANDYVASVTVVGSQTEVGHSDNVPSAAVIKRTSTDADVTSNYAITYTNGTLTVNANPKTLEIASLSDTVVYDAGVHKKEVYTVKYGGETVTPDASGKVFTLSTGDKLTITPAFDGITHVADNAEHNNRFTYTLENNTYYTGTRDTTFGTVMVKQREITVSVPNAPDVLYTGVEQASAETYTFSNVVTGETATIAYVAAKGTDVGTYTGSYPDVFTVMHGENDVTTDYTLTTKTPGTLTINRASVTVTADDKTKVYGDADPELTWTATGMQNSEDAHSLLTVTTTREAGQTVGTYTITPSGEAVQGNYNVVYETGTLTIVKDTVTVMANAQTKVYGDADETLTATLTGLNTGDPQSLIAYTVNRAAGEDVGKYVITPAGAAEQGNYYVKYVCDTLTITRATATVTADANSKVYGETDPTLTATVTGLKRSDAASVISYTVTRATGEAVGDYTITPAGDAEQGNYNVTYVTGTFTITRATATVTANDATKVYGADDPASFTATVTGLQNGDTESVLTYTVTRAAGENVGDYTITPSGNAVQGNYNVTYVTGTFKITPAAAIVKADAQTKVYGDADPTLTVTITGLQNEDASSVIAYDIVRATGENIGEYTITPSGAAVQGNYNVTYVKDTLTITPAAVTVKADAKTKVYGEADPTLTATVTGLKNGDTESVLSYTLSRADGNNVGKYVITPAGAAVQGNYNVTYVNDTLTITPATATVTADAKTKVYGAADPTLTATVTGLQNGDDESVLSYTLSRVPGDTVGTYTITPAGDAVQGNYNVTYVPGTFTITKATLTIAAKAQTYTYNGAAQGPAGTYTSGFDTYVTVTGLQSGDALASITLAGSKTDAGTYTGVIVPSAAIVNNGSVDRTSSYEIEYTNADLTINPKTGVIVTITGNVAEYGADGSNHSVSGYVATTEDALYDVDHDFTFSGSAVASGTTPGTYPMGLMASQFNNTNTNFTGVTFNVTDGKLIIYPELIATVDTVGISCNSANGTSNDGKATVTVTGGKKNNGKYSFQFGTDPAADVVSDSTYTNLSANNYTVKIVDSLNTVVEVTFTLHEPAEMTAAITVPTDEAALCPTQSTYPVSVAVTNGIPEYTYAWGSDATNVNAASTTVANASFESGHTYTATVTVEDDHHCTVTATNSFTVVDNEKPVFTAPADTTICRVLGAISANPTVTGEVATADVTDNCSASDACTISWYDADTTGADNTLRIIHRRWVVTDLCGNADTIAQNITVRPSILTSGNVTYTEPEPIAVTLKYGVCDTLINTAFNWTNNMTGNTVVVDSTATPYLPTDHRFIAEQSPYTITWTLTDDCGDQIQVTQTITVNYPPCGGTVKTNADGDGIEYATVQVGCNCWMAENSRTTKYADGTAVTPAPMTYGTPVSTYGYLYNYYAATRTTPPSRSSRAVVTGQGICPDGWHIPDEDDFVDLMSHYDNASDLMSTENWVNPGTNASGYGLEPAGLYNSELDRNEYLLVQTYLWSFTPGSTIYHACQFGSACGTIEIIPSSASNGYSVRCVRNAE